ncbi:unnamed protein product [Rotaria sordida]|uniref:Uncharacterized protein n=2 Tax=Rotaria sordida TaxID=392033 RepID=A0A814RUH9_9BILA|nr:unnamed protein product [Rotaria sordida]CAF1138519.1 unnamed protein product [Rotaria sordida]CAF1141223.1 unnamed protein product [Rotaria sordida]CAF1189780.1 unnamed protein product [Rotaria sordida]CAF1268530.1 unnamed protein product [Rotaria sordida]
MAEKNVKDPIDKSLIIVIIIVVFILIGVIIAIPLIYVNGRDQGESIGQNLTNISTGYVKNECTQTMKDVKPITYLSNEEPFPYKFHSYLYRPSVILKKVALIFGFNHDNNSWSLDFIKFVDTTTKSDLIRDGNFEENYLRKYYYQCILSNTRSSISDILFDIPYEQDFYYNDQTKVGMTYLIQNIDVIGGRYYNISFYLENRGYPGNYFVLLVGPLN